MTFKMGSRKKRDPTRLYPKISCFLRLALSLARVGVQGVGIIRVRVGPGYNPNQSKILEIITLSTQLSVHHSSPNTFYCP